MTSFRPLRHPLVRLCAVVALFVPLATCGDTTAPQLSAIKVAFGTQPSNVVAGEKMSPAVTVGALNVKNLVVTGATASVSIALVPPAGTSGATLGGTSTRAAVDGVATFDDLTITKAASGYTMVATAGDLVLANSGLFTVSPGPARTMAFKTQPANATSGASISPSIEVTVVDAFGNVATTANTAVTLAITSGSGASGAALSGTSTVTASNGVATFSGLKIDKAAAGYTLTATATGLDPVTTTTFTVSPGPAAKILVTTQPASVVAGAPISAQFTLQDAQGNPATNATNAVSMGFGANQAGATLGGTLSVNAVAGVATFNALTVNKVGTGYSLTASGTGLQSVTTATFDVSTGAAAKLGVVTQPANANATTVLNPTVQIGVQDAQGNAIASATTTVTMALGANPGGGTLGGTKSVGAVAGVATFADLTIDKSGTGYTLTAIASGLTSVTTSAFNIGTGSATTMALNGGDAQSGTAGAALATKPSVIVKDAGGNPVSGVSVTFAVGLGGGTVTGGTQTTNAAGVATVGGWTLGKTVGSNSLIAMSGSLSGSPITFTATGVAGAAAAIALNAGNNQSASKSSAVFTPPSVKITDANGNAVSGTSVSFVPSNGGSVTGSPALSNASGIATVGSWTLGPSSNKDTLTAIATGFSQVPVVFVATAGGVAAVIAVNGGDLSTAIAHTALTTNPSIKVTDVNGVAIPNVSVTFAVVGDSGTITGATKQTDGSGVATVGSWLLGLGTNTLTATSGTLAGSPVTFTGTGVTGPATTMVVTAGSGQTATVGATLPTNVSVKITDAGGNPIKDSTVTFSTSTGSVAGGTVLTNANGVATAGSWTISTASGTNSVSIASTGLTTLNVTATGTAGAAATIAVNAGDGQSATVGSAVTTKPSVIVKDAFGNPVSGVSVTYTVVSGGGSITASTPTTNASGIATVGSWTLGNSAGANTLGAASAGLTGSPVTFTATANVGAATTIAKNDGDAQTLIVGGTLLPSVIVKDAKGNGVSGVDVTFAVASGGGSITGSPTITTDASGIARIGGWKLGNTAGSNTLTATKSGITGSPLTFTATGKPASVASVVAESGIPSSATVGSTINSGPRGVVVKDAFGNPVSGVSVFFFVLSDSGTITGDTPSTNASGIAEVTSWTLGKSVGTNSIIAYAIGLESNPVTISVQATAGPIAAMTIAGGNNQSAAITSLLPIKPSVKVTDANGNAIADEEVQFDVTGGSGTLAGLTQVFAVTDASGIATLPVKWKLGGTAGPNALKATSTTTTSVFVTFAATATAGGPASIDLNPAATASQAQTATVATAVSIAPSVIVKDISGTAISGASVTFTASGGGGTGSVTSGTVLTNASGIATVGSWTLGGTAGADTLTATVSGLSFVFTATGTAGAATEIVAIAGDNQTRTAGTAVFTSPKVKVTDSHGNGIDGVSVTFAVASGGGSITGGGASQTTSGGGFAMLTGNWILGTTAGPNTLTATSSPSLTGSPVTFTATGTAAGAFAIAVSAGNNQTATVGTTVATAPAVKVTDLLGNGVAGVTVSFAGVSGSGQIITNSVRVTDASGVAAVDSWKIGNTTGTYTMAATSGSLSGSPLTFTATATADVAAHIAINAGGTQTGTAGAAVGTKPSVKVTDAHGNAVSGTSITFAVTAGGGSATGTSATTGSDGIATVGTWTLGTTAGSNTMTASSVGLPESPLTFTVTANAGAATQLIKNTGDAQTATAGSAVTIAPSVIVKDVNDNVISGASITFTIASGGGSIGGQSSSTVTTDASGVATISGWTLGKTAGANTLTAAKSGLTTVTFSATGTVGPAAKITVTAGSGQAALVGATVTTAPAVKVADANDNGINGASVTFAITAGGGSIAPSGTRTTDAAGAASLTSWTLGGSAGTNTLSVSTAGVTPITIDASAVSPASITINNGDKQAAMINTNVPTAPSVVVKDAGGSAIAGLPVTFTIASGDGLVSGASTATATTNASGVATAASWTLGATGGPNTVTASIPGSSATTATLNAAGCETGSAAGSNFNITLCITSSMTANQKAAFTNAASRWESIITGDLPASFMSSAAGTCSANHYALNMSVDDVVIFATVESIDGVGNTLGQAGPCFIRNSGQLPVTGIMRFDSADLDQMENDGTLTPVILHEMGHVLGFGSIWTNLGKLQDASSSGTTLDTYFSGANAIAAFNSAGGTSYTGQKVPVDNVSGQGTINSHWRESVMTNELMTGFISSSNSPLSAITISAMQDLGYTVSTATAEAFSMSFGLRALTHGPRREMHNDLLTGPLYTIDQFGNKRRIR